MPRLSSFRAPLAVLAGCAGLWLCWPAGAQVLGGALGGLPGQVTGPLSDRLGEVAAPPAAALPVAGRAAEGALASGRALTGERLLQLRLQTVSDLLRRYPRLIEPDPQGNPAVRGEILAVQPGADALAAAEREGFGVIRRSALADLGLDTVVLAPPRRMSTADAIARLRQIDPSGAYDFNHLYQATGAVQARTLSRGAEATEASPPLMAARPARTGPPALGLVDGSISASPAVSGRTRITQKAFGPGGARATDHATALASLMVGQPARRYGTAPAGSLFVADVYGPSPAGGSAEIIARALAWIAQNKVRVVNISLVGPPNRLLELAVAAVVARDVMVVAAVGNDGPGAAPLYPAAYPRVIGVTGVDGARRVLVEAGRGPQVDFAAPGADLAAETVRGPVQVRGTSFASAIVAGLLASHGGDAEALAATAIDLGAPGPDPVYGRGFVGAPPAGK